MSRLERPRPSTTRWSGDLMAESAIKKIELAIRRFYNARAGGNAEPMVVEAPKVVLDIASLHRVLLLRQDRIGDVLVSTPIISALRKHLPSARIDVVLSTNNIAVRQAIEDQVNHIHVFRKSLLHLFILRRILRQQRYDLVIDMMDNASSTSALLISGARARWSIGVDKVNRGVYSHVVPLADQTRVHIVERIARLLWPLGISLQGDDLRLSFPLTADQRQQAKSLMTDPRGRRVLAVNISGSDVHRMYPEEMMARLVQAIAARWCHDGKGGLALRLMSAPMHADMARRIGQACDVEVVPPQPSYASFAACIAAADMLLTPDTSAVHAAAAHSVPSVVLFSQDSRGLMPWLPYATPCWPCITTAGALETIDVADVLNAVEAMIESTTERNSGDA
ncbi:MAG: glycosyltransferase family 9 protein [Candidatus Kapabacteria bacterium]|nr:glycosyltransferase family 9 protein [Candidatus Kapabacteria bacterium]